MPYFGSTWEEDSKDEIMKQYFMYGVLVSYQSYLDIKTTHEIDDVLKGDDNIRGIFSGRDKEFMIIGNVLETVENQDEAIVVPELNETKEIFVKSMVNKKYGIYGEFKYYFIKN